MSQWSIAGVSSLTDLSPHTLRYYERIGLMTGVQRGSGGRRVYHEADVGWIRFLQMLRSTGMPLDQIAEFVQLEKCGTDTLSARRVLLREQRQRLEDHIRTLNDTLGALNEKITHYDNANPDNCRCLQGDQPHGL
jgi:DNA-binding transcriptional MerR regulator